MRLYSGVNAFASPVSKGEPAAGSDGYSWSVVLRSARDDPGNQFSETKLANSSSVLYQDVGIAVIRGLRPKTGTYVILKLPSEKIVPSSLTSP